MAVSTAACIALLFGIGPDLLTPVFFYAGAQGRPAVKPILLVAEFAVLITVLREPRRLGMSLAWALSLITIILMPLNFVASLMLSGWNGPVDLPNRLFWFYYVLQLPILVTSVRDLKRSGQM